MTKKRTKVSDSPLCDPERYFNDGHFQPAILAQDLVDELTIITLTSTKEIFEWIDGCYIGGSEGESNLLSYLMGILGDRLAKISQHHITELLNQIRLRSYQSYEIFDSDLDLLPVKNGVLNTRTGEFEGYNKTKHFFLFQLPVNYDPKADCPVFKAFVSEIVYPTDVLVVQEVFGYCLWRDGLVSIKKAIMMLGIGDNAKSTLLFVLVSMLGKENVEAISLTNLAENRFASANLRGKLANIHPDLPDKSLRETGQFKGLTGDDPMPYEIKHGGQGKFINRAKFIFAANKLPDAQDESPAYYTRWAIVNFPYQFVRGKEHLSSVERLAKDKQKLKAGMTTPEELSGVLNWSLEGLRRLQANGCFTNEISTDKMKDLYVRLANSLKAFLLDMCDVTADLDDHLSKEEFYQTYARYCEDRRLMPFTKEKVGRDLPSCHPGKVVAGRDYVGKDRAPTWRGIHLKNKDELAASEDQMTLDQSGEADG